MYTDFDLHNALNIQLKIIDSNVFTKAKDWEKWQDKYGVEPAEESEGEEEAIGDGGRESRWGSVGARAKGPR